MKTSVRANRNITLGDLTEKEKFWNDYDHDLRKERVHVIPTVVYTVTAYSGKSKAGAWASIIDWPRWVELVHGATNNALPEYIRLLAAFRTLSAISEGREITYYAPFEELVGKLNAHRNASPGLNKSNDWQLLQNLVGKRNVEWRFDVNNRAQIDFCRKIVAIDLQAISRLGNLPKQRR
jgi:hypothetical protein